MNDKKIPYYKVNKLIWRWSRKDGAEGCQPVREAALSMDRPPPPLREQPAVEASAVETKPPASKPAPRSKVGLIEILQFFARIHDRLNAPEPPKPPKPELLPKPKKVDTVPPFDIQEIPRAMRKLLMPVSAQLMERWFAGRLNYSPQDADEQKEVNQDGKPYPPDMYDTTTVKMDWVLKFPRAKQQYDYLIREAIRSPAANVVLADKIRTFDKRLLGFSTAGFSKDHTAYLHEKFHFQYAPVSSDFSQKLKVLLAATWERSGVPDDLTGALGSFNFYAAIGSVRSTRNIMSRQTVVELTGIWVYVKDNYTFTDRTDARSQYLGHWSRNGVVVVPLDIVAASSRYVPYLDCPVTLGDPGIRGNVYYPIHNSDFRQWAVKHQRGGDFVIYSDRRFIPVIPPIRIAL